MHKYSTLKHKIMKRTFPFLLLTVAFAFSIAGCNSGLHRAFIKRYQCHSEHIANPQTVEDFLVISRYHYNAGEMDCALGAAEEAVRRDPQNARAYSARGLAHYGAKEYREALPDYKISLLLDDKNPETFYNRAELYWDMKALDSAADDMTRAIELAKNSEEFEYALDSWINERGRIHFDKGDYENALADFNQAVRLKPDNYIWYKDRAKLYRRIGKNDEAVADESKSESLKAEEDERKSSQ